MLHRCRSELWLLLQRWRLPPKSWRPTWNKLKLLIHFCFVSYMAIKTLIVSIWCPKCHKALVFSSTLNTALLADDHFPIQLGKQGKFVGTYAHTKLELHDVGQQLFYIIISDQFNFWCTFLAKNWWILGYFCSLYPRGPFEFLVRVGSNLIMHNTSRNEKPKFSIIPKITTSLLLASYTALRVESWRQNKMFVFLVPVRVSALQSAHPKDISKIRWKAQASSNKPSHHARWNKLIYGHYTATCYCNVNKYELMRFLLTVTNRVKHLPLWYVLK